MVVSVEKYPYFMHTQEYVKFLIARRSFYHRIYSDWERIEIFLWDRHVATLFNDHLFDTTF